MSTFSQTLTVKNGGFNYVFSQADNTIARAYTLTPSAR
jgi:hypothetical protein